MSKTLSSQTPLLPSTHWRNIALAILTMLIAVATSEMQIGMASVQADEDVFRSQVRTTEPLSPDEQQTRFHLPTGFEITLFASEPQLQKPLNMAFDADGRLWVTGSNEYPFPAEEGKGRDSVRILEDTDGDGRADKVTVFADNLNIPIGLYPWQDGVIVFSIPNILFLRDTNGDGKADESRILYGPFDTTRDTHGMNNAFRRGFDGWLYACHGFNNQSVVSGKDGHEVRMSSGNTYRFRMDGSRIEHFTHGQVNPFGMTQDANGDLFTSDCHTKPVTLLIRDGFYESFGKPHDGLGFVPNVMEHQHGSTAIDAICQYQGQQFPVEYQDDLFVGNVMTCRVHRNSIVRQGASVRLQEEEDFLTSDDPWFRPVDIQTGPDGALYVADFYNRIIGHYEVPLDHPGRDRERGRIWKITYPDSANPASASVPQLTTATLPQLISHLNDERLPIRRQAADQICDRMGPAAVEQLTSALQNDIRERNARVVTQILWCLHRLNGLTTEQLQQALSLESEQTSIHVMKICSESPSSESLVAVLKTGLRHSSALVRRAAADAAGRHAHVELLKELINAKTVADSTDVHLLHAIRIGLRNQLRFPESSQWFSENAQPAIAAQQLVDVLPGLDGPEVSTLTAAVLKSAEVDPAAAISLLQHAAGHTTNESAADLVHLALALPVENLRDQSELYQALADGFGTARIVPPVEFQKWSERLAIQIFEDVSPDDVSWGQYQWNGKPVLNWGFEPRLPRPGAAAKAEFLSSLPGSERAVGVLRSRPFVLPLELKIEVCGHLGFPDQSPSPDNRVVLRDFETGSELASILPPRNDTAATTELNLAGTNGRKGYLEIIDGLDLRAYAWLAVGRISPPVVKAADFDGGFASEQLAAAVRILAHRHDNKAPLSPSETDRLKQIVMAIQLDGPTRRLAAEALLKIRDLPEEYLSLPLLLEEATLPRPVDQLIVDVCVNDKITLPESRVVKSVPTEAEPTSLQTESSPTSTDVFRLIFAQIDQHLRTLLSTRMATQRHSAEMLMTLMESGVPSAQLLRDQRLAQQLSGFDDQFAKRISSLISSLPPVVDGTQQLAASLLTRLKLEDGDPSEGQRLFTKHCSACHRRAGQGGIAGPQLDGIGTRGPSRLIEDILQPNQNVDIAFRTSVVVMKDGRVLTGLLKDGGRDDEKLLIATDGKSQTISTNDIEETRLSNLSLMPANLATQITPDEFLHLIAWLSH